MAALQEGTDILRAAKNLRVGTESLAKVVHEIRTANLTRNWNLPSKPKSEIDGELEALAQRLEASPNYRVLRKLVPRQKFAADADTNVRLAAIVDLETTGLDVQHDEIIEFAIVKFSFSEADAIVSVIDEYSALNESVKGIPDEVAVLTGISQADVIGKTLDAAKIENILSDVSIIIAHNASFDRPIFERYFPTKTNINWACSATDIDWKSEGRTSAKLEFLLSCDGYFYDSHRALSDCRALLELLSMPLPRSKVEAFKVLIETARRPKFRIFAVGVPFDTRLLLKKRGYRWSDGTTFEYKAWWKDLNEENLDAEVAFLRKMSPGFDGSFPTIRMTAQNRYRTDPS